MDLNRSQKQKSPAIRSIRVNIDFVLPLNAKAMPLKWQAVTIEQKSMQ